MITEKHIDTILHLCLELHDSDDHDAEHVLITSLAIICTGAENVFDWDLLLKIMGKIHHVDESHAPVLEYLNNRIEELRPDESSHQPKTVANEQTAVPSYDPAGFLSAMEKALGGNFSKRRERKNHISPEVAALGHYWDETSGKGSDCICGKSFDGASSLQRHIISGNRRRAK